LDNRLELLYLFFKLGYSRISRVDGHDSNVPSNHVSEQVFSRTLNSYALGWYGDAPTGRQ
ncbi:MAG: hypothetical protein QNJ97_07250, partial [Myxococcota bacterium]|nr:hypothetical protein [Myxococcota bacterium]